MLTLPDILYGVALPFAIALVALLITWRPWSKRAEAPVKLRALATLGILAAFVTAWCVTPGILSNKVKFPPSDANQWTLFYTVIIALAAIVESLVPRMKLWLRGILNALVSGGLIALVLWKPIVPRDQLAIAIGAAVVVVLASGIASQRARGVAMPIVLTFYAGIIAVLVMTSGSQKLGQIAGMLAAAGMASVVVAFWRGKDFSLSRGGGVIALTLIATALLFGGRYYAEVEPRHLWMTLATPVIALVASFIPVRKYWLSTALIVLLSLTPAAIAVTQSIIRFRQGMIDSLLM